MRWVSLFALLLSAFGHAETLPIPKKPQRIVALAPHIVENLYTIGAGERIVGAVEYSDYPKPALDIPRIGGFKGLQLEALLALNPDLVIAWRSGNNSADLNKLIKLGIPVIYSETKQLELIPEELRRLGRITQQEQEAEKAAQVFEKRLSQLKARYSNKEKLDAFYQLWPAPMMTISGKTWLHQLLETCSVNNVFANASTEYPQIGIENVLAKKPQVIVMPDEKTKQNIQKVNWEEWTEIPAVASSQYIEVNADILHRFSVRVLDGLEQMCGKLDLSRQFYRNQDDNVE